MQNNDCIHDFGKWKKMKKVVLELESDDDESPSFLSEVFHRKCKNCGLVERRIERIDKKGKNKHLGLKMKGLD